MENQLFIFIVYVVELRFAMLSYAALPSGLTVRSLIVSFCLSISPPVLFLCLSICSIFRLFIHLSSSYVQHCVSEPGGR